MKRHAVMVCALVVALGLLGSSVNGQDLTTLLSKFLVDLRAGRIQLSVSGIGTTPTDGHRLANATAAANGAQQYSPRTCWEGRGWKSDATAASQSLVGCVEMRPMQGAARAGGGVSWYMSIDGGASVRTGYVNARHATLTTNIEGWGNTFLGWEAGNVNFTAGTDAYNNTFIGGASGRVNDTGFSNTFLGAHTGAKNVAGVRNTFLGDGAGFENVGSDSTLVGYHAGVNLVGAGSRSNTVVGGSAAEGASGATANALTVVGADALGSNNLSTAASIVAVGRNAGFEMTQAARTTLIGDQAGYAVTTGSDNVMLGQLAGYTNTAANATTTGAQNTFVGSESGASTTSQLSNAIAIGYRTFVSISNQVVLGNTSIISTILRGRISITQATPPTCSANCGTDPVVVGSDSAMTVTMGTSGSPASGWVITFNGTWAAAPSCTVQMGKAGMVVGKLPLTAVTTTTTVTVVTNGTAPATEDVYHVLCFGRQIDA